MDRFFFFSSRRRHTRCLSDWSSDVCSSDLPQGHMQMMVRMADYGLGPQGAIDGPRFRVVQGLDVTFEDEWPEATIADLAARGHRVMKLPEDYNAFGCAQIAYKLEDGYLCASDARRDSLPVGF